MCRNFNWYYPPDSNVELFDLFEQFLRKIDDKNKEIIISGDFNCDQLRKNNEDKKLKKLNDLMHIYQLQQHIDKPTRITPTSKTLIDIILTKIEDARTLDSGVIDLGISDHSFTYICRKGNYESLKADFH